MRIASERQISTYPAGLESLETLPPVHSEQIPTSMLYTMLPSIIRNRIPKLPSIRSSVSDFHGRPNHVRSISMSAQDSGSETPPPTYTSRQGSVTPDRWSAAMTDTEESDDTSTYDRPISSSSALPVFTSSGTENGINGKYANQGN
jgi:hypothetical protein